MVKCQTPTVNCQTMGEVRHEIDRIDRALVALLAERQTYIEQAGHIKGTRDAVIDQPRIEDVIAKVLDESDARGLSRDIAEPVWRLLMDRSIAHEFAVFDAKKKAAG